MAYKFLMTIHVSTCLLMILVVLLQSGRGAGLTVFGGSGDSLITTPSGSSFMKKFTAGLAGTFAFTSLFLTLISARSGMGTVTSHAQPPAASTPAGPAAPAAPAAPAVPGPR